MSSVFNSAIAHIHLNGDKAHMQNGAESESRDTELWQLSDSNVNQKNISYLVLALMDTDWLSAKSVSKET